MTDKTERVTYCTARVYLPEGEYTKQYLLDVIAGMDAARKRNNDAMKKVAGSGQGIELFRPKPEG